MQTQIISKFFELPKTKTAWWAFGLGLIVLIGILAFLFVLAVPVKIDEGINDKGYYIVQLATKLLIIVLIELIILIPGIKTNMKSYKDGERSWISFIGYLPYILVGLFLPVVTIFLILLSIFT